MLQWELCSIYLVAGKVSVLYYGQDTKAVQYDESELETVLAKLKQAGWEKLENDEMDGVAGCIGCYRRPASSNLPLM